MNWKHPIWSRDGKTVFASREPEDDEEEDSEDAGDDAGDDAAGREEEPHSIWAFSAEHVGSAEMLFESEVLEREVSVVRVFIAISGTNGQSMCSAARNARNHG